MSATRNYDVINAFRASRSSRWWRRRKSSSSSRISWSSKVISMDQRVANAVQWLPLALWQEATATATAIAAEQWSESNATKISNLFRGQSRATQSPHATRHTPHFARTRTNRRCSEWAINQSRGGSLRSYGGAVGGRIVATATFCVKSALPLLAHCVAGAGAGASQNMRSSHKRKCI